MATWIDGRRTESSVRPAKAGTLSTGTRTKGEFRCSGCGYGVAIHDALPACPMCRGERWEQVPWRPFTRAAALSGEDVVPSPHRLQ